LSEIHGVLFAAFMGKGTQAENTKGVEIIRNSFSIYA